MKIGPQPTEPAFNAKGAQKVDKTNEKVPLPEKAELAPKDLAEQLKNLHVKEPAFQELCSYEPDPCGCGELDLLDGLDGEGKTFRPELEELLEEELCLPHEFEHPLDPSGDDDPWPRQPEIYKCSFPPGGKGPEIFQCANKPDGKPPHIYNCHYNPGPEKFKI